MDLNLTSPMVICDDADTMKLIVAALTPIVKNVATASSSKEAYEKAANQVFSFYVVRTKTPFVGNAQSFFGWCCEQKTHSASPWFVLGDDVEKPESLLKHKQVRMLPNATNLVQLLQTLRLAFPPERPLTTLDIKPLLTSIVTTLRTALGQELTRGETSLKFVAAQIPKSHVAGSIHVKTPRMQGSMTLHFSESALNKMQETMLGRSSGMSGKNDLMTKLTSCVTEYAKEEFRVSGHDTFSLESDPDGARYRDSLRAPHPVYVKVPFSSLFGEVTVECMVSLLP